LKLLRDHFDYHPEFKRWSDTFSAVPFRPKWIRKNMSVWALDYTYLIKSRVLPPSFTP
jgi:hypothetical protein